MEGQRSLANRLSELRNMEAHEAYWSKLDVFAAAALTGIVAQGFSAPDDAARKAFNIAESAMIERKERQLKDWDKSSGEAGTELPPLEG